MLKKLISKKGAAVCAAALLCLGVCDLTIAEKSHLMPVVESVRDTVSDTIDDVLGKEKEAEVKTLIQGGADAAE